MKEWTSLKLIEWTADYFTKKEIPNPRLDAEWLLAAVLKCQRIDLYTQYNKPLQQAELDRYRAFVERRAKREPLQYILGETEFYGLPIKVTPDVLVPRPETEQLVEKGLSIAMGGARDRLSRSDRTRRLEVLEIGTGSGCIAVALAKNLEDAQITATDQSLAALEVAKQNAVINGVAEGIEFAESDLFPVGSSHPFDLVVSNPPYVSSDELETLQTEVRDWEPRVALNGGPDGLDVYRRIVAGLNDWLAPGGAFIGEIGNDQEEAIQKLFREQVWCQSVAVTKDLAGQPRIVIANRA